MKRLLIAGLIMIQACSTSDNYVRDRFSETTPEGLSTAVAHRGCWFREADGEFYIPENSTYGIDMAQRYGYPAIELDVKYTLDGMMVVMHDGTINRTMRNASDYSRIEKPVRVENMLFEDLRKDYVLESSNPAMRTPIPTLEEMLRECKKTGIIPMLHSKVLESYSLAQKILGNRWIAFDVNLPSMKVARRTSDCLILWDPDRLSAEETIEVLKELGGWCGMSTMKHDMQDSCYIAKIQEAGFLTQSSIFPTPYERQALHDGTDIELTDFYWHQSKEHSPVQTISEDISLAAGESWKSPVADAGDFAALTIHLDFCGSIVLKVDDLKPRVYSLHRDVPGEEVVGLRLYKTAPSFEIEAADDVRIKIEADIYKL